MSLSTRGAGVRMAGFAVTAVVALLLELAPLGLSASAAPSPDLLAAAIFFWALRRPEATPVLLVFVVALTRDLLTGGPVGPVALSLVLGAEAIRARDGAHIQAHFEFALFAVFILLTGLGAWLLVWITASGAPAPSVALSRAALTLACYPLVFLLLQSVFRVRSRELAERRAAGGFW